jgi:hypothetical protein
MCRLLHAVLAALIGADAAVGLTGVRVWVIRFRFAGLVTPARAPH